MNLLDKEFLADPVAAIKRIVSYSKQKGQSTTFEAVRSWLFTCYLTLDAKSGTNHAEQFATATNLPESEREKLRYQWGEDQEKLEVRKAEFEKDPLWTGKEKTDWIIAIQKPEEGSIAVSEDAPVKSAKKIHLNINDFLKAMFLYVSGKEHGFICKASEFNQDSYKFTGTLRIFF